MICIVVYYDEICIMATELDLSLYLCVNSTIPGLGGREFRRPTTLENSCIIVVQLVHNIIMVYTAKMMKIIIIIGSVLQDDGWRENGK